MATLIITLPAPGASSAELSYVLVAQTGALEGHGQAAPALLPRSADVTLLAPASALSWHRLSLPKLGAARYFDLMRVDKKADAGMIRYVLLKSLGAAFVAAVPDAQVLPVLEAHSAHAQP